MKTPSANDYYHAAQDFLRIGQPVFPCRPANGTTRSGREVYAKSPLTRNGLHDATLDRDTVKSWWRQNKAAALGIPTGIVFDVLDVDVKNIDGRVHLPRLTDLGLLNGCKRVVKTPSGGWHLFFTAAAKYGLEMTNHANADLGLDVRGTGGYVLAAPSYIETDEYAGFYEDAGETEGSTDEPLMWDLIVSALVPTDHTAKPVDLLPSERQASIAALREWVSIRQPGERNNSLHWAVCRCIESNIDPNELIEAALLTGMTEDEIKLTINAALKRAGLKGSDMLSEGEALFGRAGQD